MRVVDFLRGGGTLADLEAKYAIKNRRHGELPHLVLLKYNQISSPFAEPIVRECRGLILDESDNWRPVSRAFDKFFNHGEGHAAPIDWSTARVQEKLDGSLCVLYHYAGRWHVATSGTPDASGPVGAEATTFAELFWRVFAAQGLLLPDADRCVFVFELTSPLNRVVVPHLDSRLTLLAVRDMETMAEEPPADWDHRFPVVRSFALQSFEDIAASFATMEPLRQEGYVVVDGAFNRVKVKHPGYVAIHSLKGEHGPSLKRMLDIARTGEGSELLAHFPEWRPVFEDAAGRLSAFVAEVAQDFDRINAAVGPTGTQKDFALLATKTRCSAALFQLRAKKIATPRDFAAQMQLDTLADLLGIRSEAA